MMHIIRIRPKVAKDFITKNILMCDIITTKARLSKFIVSQALVNHKAMRARV